MLNSSNHAKTATQTRTRARTTATTTNRNQPRQGRPANPLEARYDDTRRMFSSARTSTPREARNAHAATMSQPEAPASRPMPADRVRCSRELQLEAAKLHCCRRPSSPHPVQMKAAAWAAVVLAAAVVSALILSCDTGELFADAQQLHQQQLMHQPTSLPSSSSPAAASAQPFAPLGASTDFEGAATILARQQQPLAVKAAPISAKGALYFQRIATAAAVGASGAPHPQTGSVGPSKADQAASNQNQILNLNQSPAKSSSSSNHHPKCPQFQPQQQSTLLPLGLGTSKLQMQTQTLMPVQRHQQQQHQSMTELLGVEGTNLKVNLVLTGHRVPGSSSPSSPMARPHQQQQQQPSPGQHLADAKLAWQWVKTSPESSGAIEQVVSSSWTSSAGQQQQRVSSIQLASELDHETIRHLFQLPAPGYSGYNASGAQHQAQPTITQEADADDDNLAHELEPSKRPFATTHGHQHQEFMLAPFANERQLLRLDSGQLGAATRPLVQQALRRVQQQQLRSSPDDFIGDGSQIHWHKLGAYLRFKETELFGSPAAPSPHHPDPLAACQQQQRLSVDSIDQLQVLQVEFQQLQLADRGLYELYVCQQPPPPPPSSSSGGQPVAPGQSGCQASGQLVASLQLQVAEDVPKLESWFEAQLLEPGDRFSIKCEATGFTLPQISWYLDGQLLSEQSTGQQQQHHASTGPRGQGPLGAHSDQSMLLLAASSDDSLQEDGQSHLHDDVGGSQQQQQPTAHSMATKFRIGDYVSQDNHVHSFVNSSFVRPGDGGFYKCLANNGFHQVEHGARVDVRGPATIERPLASNLSSLIGAPRLQLQCPYSGYPVLPIEWYFKALTVAPQQSQPQQPADYSQLDTGQQHGYQYHGLVSARRAARSMGERRRLGLGPASGPSELAALDETEAASNNDGDDDQLQQQQQNDPDKDEWLSQASSMTMSPEDYPEPLPDYPQLAGAGRLAHERPEQQQQASYYDSPAAMLYSVAADYSDIQMDFQQEAEADLEVGAEADRESELGPDDGPDGRRKRDLASQGGGSNSDQQHQHQWLKLPQSRRQQVHPNGTLIIHEISRQDHGLYKCRVASPAAAAAAASSNQQEQQQHLDSVAAPTQVEPQWGDQLQAWSNELQLNILVAPVISPFGSSESLREGMRNFLTCSVIEGDSPVRLRWFKDGRPLEAEAHHLGSPQRAAAAPLEAQLTAAAPTTAAATTGTNAVGAPSGQPARSVRVEQTNEYTSTLYFSQVESRDSGNYTCMASNKAASVNYTTRMLVNVPPKWVKIPRDVDCVAGQNIVIDCQADGRPNPRIWWEVGVQPAPLQPTGDQKQLLLLDNPTGQQQQQPISARSRQPATGAAAEAPITVAPMPAPLAAQALNQPPNHYRTIISNSRIHILENASLVIRDVGKQDQAYYLCQAANNFGLISSLIKLTVNVGASFQSKYLIKYVKLNERVELDCDPSGQSPVSVTWFMRPKQQQQQQQLNELQHQQPYKLLASANQSAPMGPATNAGTLESGSTSGRRLFSAVVRPELSFANQLRQQDDTRSPSSSSSFLSPSESSPSHPHSKAVEIDSSISFEVVQVPQQQQHQQHQHQAGANQRRMSAGSELVRMYIKQARRAHSADYICQASNQFGSDEKLVKLLVQEPPDSVDQISAVQVDSRSISLAWSVPFNGNSPILTYTVEWRPLVVVWPANTSGQQHQQTLSMAMSTAAAANQSSHQQPAAPSWRQLNVQQPACTLGQLDPMTSYEIRVRAQNQFGRAAWSSQGSPGYRPVGLEASVQHEQHIPFIVTTSEEAPIAPPSDVRALPLSSTSLQVSWLPPNNGNPNGNNNNNNIEQPLGAAASLPPSTRHPTYSIKGYYLGYRLAHSQPSGQQQQQQPHASSPNESFIFKTVSMASSSSSFTPISLVDLQQQQPYLLDRATGLARLVANGSARSAPAAGAADDSRRVRVVIGDLRRSTRYSIIVQAFNSAGPGPQSDAIEARTLVNDPPPAPMLRVGSITYTSIELQWSFLVDQQQQQQSLSLSQPMLDGLDDDQLLEDDDPGTLLAASPGQPATSNQRGQPVLLEDQATAGAATTATTIDGYHLYYRATNHEATGGLKPTTSGHQQQLQLQPQQADWRERKLGPESHLLRPSHPVAAGAAAAAGGQQARLDATQVIDLIPLSGLASATANESSASPMVAASQQASAAIASWQRYSTDGSSSSNNNNNGSMTAAGSGGLLGQRSFRFVLDQLACGQSYQIYLVAYNSYGTGLPSQILRLRTRGTQPIAPRRQDFLQVKPSSVLLLLDAWLDGGCSLVNFEIRYKQLAQTRAEATEILLNPNRIPASPASTATTSTTTNNNNNNHWLLLSSTINPDEQRQIELCDLQPETWYGIWATAESVSGKTHQLYAFMTLDKRGQLPPEAGELYQLVASNALLVNQAGAGGPGGPFNPATLFRSGGGAGANGSIRSILYNFSGVGGPNSMITVVSPLLISTCLCLVLFASCSMFLFRRYNSLIKDSESIDSRTTAGASTMATATTTTTTGVAANSLYHQQQHHHHHQQQQLYSSPMDNHHHNHQHQHQYQMSPLFDKGNVELQSSNSNNYITRQQAHQHQDLASSCYTMSRPVSSPCRPGAGGAGGTATIISNNGGGSSPSTTATTTTTTTQGSSASSAALLLGPNSNHNNKFEQPIGGPLGDDYAMSLAECDSHNHSHNQTCDHYANTQLHNQLQHHQSHLNKQCSTLARPSMELAGDITSPMTDHINCQHFKTLPYQHQTQMRPVSTFLPQQQPVVDQFNNSNDAQQIYSKLRLLQQFASGYNLQANNCSQQQLLDAGHQDATINLKAQEQQQQMMMQQQQQQQQQQQIYQQQQPNSDQLGQQQCQQQQQPMATQMQPTLGQQSNGAPAAAAAASEQDDYALPFPPKWV